MLRLGFAACAIAVTLVVAPLCRAQNAEPAAQTATTPRSAETAPRLGEVTVTATRVSRPAQKVTSPVLVIPMQRLQTEQVNNYGSS